MILSVNVHCPHNANQTFKEESDILFYFKFLDNLGFKIAREDKKVKIVGFVVGNPESKNANKIFVRE